jgi:pimeloyl-ACP methyl ester carboxylesterase
MLLVRRLLRALAVVAFLAVVALVVGGYYFATQINADGLRVDPYVPERDLTVVRASPTSLTLRERDERVDELRTRGTYGVSWPTGYGQVIGITDDEKDVTRAFRLLTGRLPAEGEAVALTEDAFPDNPSVALERGVQEVTLTSPAGRFPAWYVGGTPTWVVLVHGKGASRTSMLRMMRVPVRLGLSALDITYRNDALLPQDETRRYRYGRTEWEDLEAAVAYAEQHGAKRVVLAGASMGGAIIASFLERSDKAGLVTGLVLDAPALSFADCVDLGASKRHVPAPLTWTAKQLASVRYGVNWHDIDYLDDTGWLDVPTLLFHGTSDDRVPFTSSARLAQRKDGFVTLEIADGVEHGESWNHDPTRYEAALARFLVTLTRR